MSGFESKQNAYTNHFLCLYQSSPDTNHLHSFSGEELHDIYSQTESQ